MDIKEISRRVHEINPDIYVVSDAVQHAPHCVIDVEDWNVDVCNFAPYKFFGVRGCGFAYVSDRVANMFHAKLLFKAGHDLAEETGLKLAFINLSGGVGIPYRPDQQKTDIFAVGEGVRQAYEEIFPEGGVAIKTELGRWMTGPIGWLVTRAIHRKDTYKHYIGVDACCANLMRPAMYGAYHHITVCGKENLPHDHLYDVVGCLCENNDKFAIDRMLPEIVNGDLVIIHDSGAHGHAMGYNYNGRLRSAEILHQQDGGFRLIRRAETAQDYFRTLDMDAVADSLGL